MHKDFNQTVRVGGVPEHFNLAWHLANERGDFNAAGIGLQWTDVPGGTGAMCKMLKNNEIDIAIALTEGVIAEISEGAPFKILQFYVNSPLRWGIFTGAHSAIKDLSDTGNLRYAISRYKSGSHLMAFVNAERLNTTINENNFVLVQNLNGARKALMNNEADLFMWEKFTTKPFVDNGEFRMLGECHTPWPCFVIAVRNDFMNQNKALVQQILEIVNQSCFSLKYNEVEAVDMIAWRYQLKLADALQWFSELEYAYAPEIDELQLTGILNDLKKLGIIKRIPAHEEICFSQHLMLNEAAV